MDQSVLDRQRAVVLQRLYPSNSYSNLLHPVVVDPQQLQSHFLPTPNWQCNSSLSSYYTEPYCVSSSPPNKRKAEFDAEEEEKEAAEAGEDDSEISMKTEKGISSNTCSNESSKVVKKPDFIHVRARRGQATDSHSLAERARREKISKKMKCLQDLVPGCDRVTGKAGMLDEIINYVQSLQKQVEFLSMKLATVNTSLDFSIDSVFAKQMPAYLASLSYNTPQQGTSDITMDLSQKPGPNPEVFLDLSFISQLQQLSGWESDWPTPFN